MEAVVFFVAAAIVLAGALGVIVSRNPVHAALSLVMTLFGVAVLFINLEAYFLAVVQVIVYAGAIVVLFLFVIMLVGVDKSEDIRTEPIIRQREFALLAGAGLLALAVIIGVAAGGEITGHAPGDLDIVRAFEDVDDIDGDGITNEIIPPSQEIRDESGRVIRPNSDNIHQLGDALFTDYVFAFEITAILLTIAVVGAVVLARRPSGDLQDLPEVDPPAALRVEPDPDDEVVTDIDEDDLAAAEQDALAEAEEATEDATDAEATS
jgi:NADH-quinone oxidoreductase subunit J